MKLRCVIVDDEPIARQIIAKYCEHLQLEVVASCADALEVKKIIDRQPADVIFLDINMPVLDGVAFARTLRSGLQIIFTTAYKEFAHEAFDLNACDYLLKPFSIDRFMLAIDKARERLSKIRHDQSDESAPFTFIRAEGKLIKVSFAEVLYVEANGNNVKIVMQNLELFPAMTFASFQEQLPKSSFVRVHRSFIVNRSMIRVIEGNRIMIGKKEIPIGANYRESFLREIGIR